MKVEIFVEIYEQKVWNKDFIFNLISSMSICFCTYFMSTALPIYAQIITGTVAYSGFMTGIYSFAALAVRPVAGLFIDKYGRKNALIFGAFLCVISCLFYELLPGIFLLLAIRVLHGFGLGIHTTTAGAVAADVIPKNRMNEGMGYFGLYSTISIALAPAIALYVIGSAGLERFRLLFLLSVLICLLGMVVDCFINYERRRKKQEGSIKPAGNMREESAGKTANAEVMPKTFLGFEYAVFLPVAVVILNYFSYSSIMSFLALYALEENIGHIGMFFTVMAAGMGFSRLFLGKFADKYGPNIVIIPGIIFFAVCFTVIPFTHSLYILVPLAFPYGMAFASVNPALNVIILNRCSPQRKGSASAAFYAAVDIGLGAGSILFGFVAALWGYTAVFLGSLGLEIAALLIFVFGLAKKEKIFFKRRNME